MDGGGSGFVLVKQSGGVASMPLDDLGAGHPITSGQSEMIS